MGDLISLIGDAVAGFAHIGASGTRRIGTLIPDIVVSELHHDHMTITRHPVETGAAISDHCFMEPPIVEMQCGASNSTGQSEGYVQAVYAQFLSLQAQRAPFSVTTGKRQYSDMLIVDIIVTNDETKENALDFTVKLEKINIVSTQTTGGAASNSSQSNPAGTSSPSDSGNQNIMPTDNGAPAFAQVSSIDYQGASTVPNQSFGSFPPSSLSSGGNEPTGGATTVGDSHMSLSIVP